MNLVTLNHGQAAQADNLYISDSQSGLYQPLGVYDDVQGVHLGFTRVVMCVNLQNNSFWAAKNPHYFHHTLLLNQKVGVWCAVSARCIIGIIFHQRVNSEHYISNILNSFVAALTKEEKTYSSIRMAQLPIHPIKLWIPFTQSSLLLD
ncbi:hypothetical protein TNCV_936741 [Trichonephila clavipes]|nr:hypothetical protein TNCV_936741 [Trichonephila clavipes]